MRAGGAVPSAHMRSLATSAALAVALAAPATACWHSQSSPTMTHLGWVPDSTSLVVAIDVDQLRRSRWWSSIAEPLVDALVLDAKRRTEMAAQCGLDPLRDTHWVLFVLDASGTTSRGAVIANGAWTAAKLERCARALGGSPEPRPDGLVRYAPGAFIGWVAPDTFAITLDDAGRAFVLEIVEHETHVTDNPAVARQLARVDGAAAVWIAGSLAQPRSPLRELGVDAGKRALGMSASFTVGDAVGGELAVELSSAGDAATIAHTWTRSLAPVQKELPFLAAITITSREALATVAVHLDAAGLDTLAKLIAKETKR